MTTATPTTTPSIHHELDNYLDAFKEDLHDLTCIRTPLVPITTAPTIAPVWCKLEYMNASGSIKDRIAMHILLKALRRGTITRGDTVTEASSGSTSMALAMACARLDLRFVAFMPEGVTPERIIAIRAYGADIRLTPKQDAMPGAVQASHQFAKDHNAFEPRQFENPDNAEAHRIHTAREIAEQMPGGRIDAVVAGVGTGGTIMGIAAGLFDHGFKPAVYAARPVTHTGQPSSVAGCMGCAETCSFSHTIPGVLDGASRLFDQSAFDGITTIDVDDTNAVNAMKTLLHLGYPVGPSSGLNLAAAQQILQTRGPDTRIVTVLCDRVERYFSMPLFQADTDQPAAP